MSTDTRSSVDAAPAPTPPDAWSTPPLWARSAAPLAAAWALGYGALRLYWALTGLPRFPPIGTDLAFFAGWGAVVLCGAAAAIAAGLAVPRLPRPVHRALVPLGLLVAATLVASCALLLLDLVGLLLGLGIPTSVAALLSRSGALAVGLLLAAAVLAAHRRARPVCPHCGRGAHAVVPDPGAVPRWAFVAAYGAATACLTRLAAEVAAETAGASAPIASGADTGPAVVAAMVAFLVGAVAAGTVLPLALVHRWGRVWPRWVLPLAGRGVPRWLVLGPAVVLGVGLVCYFGNATVQLIGAVFGVGEGFEAQGGYTALFFWTAVPAYLMWGIGLCAAAASYGARTRPHCRRCGRGRPDQYGK